MSIQTHDIAAGGGVKLHAVESGNPAGPAMLFIHGFCQSAYAWRKQLDSDLANDFRLIAIDLRGHGLSEKPLDPAAYTDGKLWADDIKAVIETLDLKRTILVGWSYAGLVVCDYLREHGQSGIAGINLVACLTLRGVERAQQYIGERYRPLFPDIFSADVAVVKPVFEAFADLCVAEQVSAEERDHIVTASMAIPAVTREAMQRGRVVDNDDLLRSTDLPALVTHGSDDAVVLVGSSEHNARLLPKSQLSIYPGIGHSPFSEDPTRFNRELRELAGRGA